MTAPVQIGNNLGAWLAYKVDYFELVAQIAIHYTCIEAIMFAWRTAAILIKPLLEAVLVENLLAIVTLDIFFLYDVKADGAQKGIDELLISLQCIIFRHFVIASQLKNVRLGDFFDSRYEVSCLLLHVLFQPCTDPKGTLIVHRSNILRSSCSRTYHCKVV